MITYQLKTFKNIDPKYLKFIDKCKPLMARMPADQTAVTHHHCFCSGGKNGNDYLSLPVTWFQHLRNFHSGTPEAEFFEMIGIDPVKEIVNHLIRYITMVLKYPVTGLLNDYSEDHIIILIKTIKAVKNERN